MDEDLGFGQRVSTPITSKKSDSHHDDASRFPTMQIPEDQSGIL